VKKVQVDINEVNGTTLVDSACIQILSGEDNPCEGAAKGNKATADGSRDMLPKEIALHSGYPNPFNPSTKINFDLPEQANVNLKVYDTLGRLVATLAARSYEAGTHSVTWVANSVPSGQYFVRMTVQGKVFTTPIMLVK